MPDRPDWLFVGRAVSAFGTKGEITIHPDTDFPQRFAKGSRLFIEKDSRPLVVEHSRLQDGRYIVKLDGINSRDEAEAVRGRLLQVPSDDLMPLGQGEYYLFQIVGLTVRTDTGRNLGAVSEVLQTGANDVYLVPTEHGEVLLPAISEVIREIDLESRVMTVHLLPGLLEE